MSTTTTVQVETQTMHHSWRTSISRNSAIEGCVFHQRMEYLDDYQRNRGFIKIFLLDWPTVGWMMGVGFFHDIPEEHTNIEQYTNATEDHTNVEQHTNATRANILHIEPAHFLSIFFYKPAHFANLTNFILFYH